MGGVGRAARYVGQSKPAQAVAGHFGKHKRKYATGAAITGIAAAPGVIGAGIGAGTGAAFSDPGMRKAGAKRGAKYGAIAGYLGAPIFPGIAGYAGRETKATAAARKRKKS
jgi:hypothetical protein